MMRTMSSLLPMEVKDKRGHRLEMVNKQTRMISIVSIKWSNYYVKEFGPEFLSRDYFGFKTFVPKKL